MNTKLSLLFLALLSVAQPALADWSTDPAKNNQVTATGVPFYDEQLLTTTDGYTYCYFIVPNENLHYRLQIMDPSGNRVLRTAGLTVSKEASTTWTKVNYPTTLDQEGNLVMAVQDMRTRVDSLDQHFLYTLYKVSRQGDILWSRSLNDSVASFDGAHLTLTSAPDNSIYAAFGESGVNYASRWLHIERFAADGMSLWSQPLLFKAAGGDHYSYPTVKALTEGGILVGFLDETTGLYQAMRFEADGSQAWEAPRTVYDGSYGSDRVWDAMEMRQLNDSTFVFVTLNADKTSVMVCFDADGQVLCQYGSYRALSNVTDYGISYDDFWYDPVDDVLNFSYRQIEVDYSSHHGIYLQQMSTEGDWYFEDEGHPLIEMQESDQYAYSCVRGTDQAGEMAVFFIKKETLSYVAPAQCYMAKVNYDAEVTMEPVAFTASDASKSDLEVSDLIDGQYYLASWLEKRGTASTSSVYMQRVYVNGDIELAIHELHPESASPTGAVTRLDLLGRPASTSAHGLFVQDGQVISIH